MMRKFTAIIYFSKWFSWTKALEVYVYDSDMIEELKRAIDYQGFSGHLTVYDNYRDEHVSINLSKVSYIQYIESDYVKKEGNPSR